AGKKRVAESSWLVHPQIFFTNLFNHTNLDVFINDMLVILIIIQFSYFVLLHSFLFVIDKYSRMEVVLFSTSNWVYTIYETGRGGGGGGTLEFEAASGILVVAK
ncbi:hypothetical protein ACJX0J_034465, partial [Zea mays]